VTFHDNTTSKWIQFNSIGSLMNRWINWCLISWW
jgi:hypothetical protein